MVCGEQQSNPGPFAIMADLFAAHGVKREINDRRDRFR